MAVSTWRIFKCGIAVTASCAVVPLPPEHAVAGAEAPPTNHEDNDSAIEDWKEHLLSQLNELEEALDAYEEAFDWAVEEGFRHPGGTPAPLERFTHMTREEADRLWEMGEHALTFRDGMIDFWFEVRRPGAVPEYPYARLYRHGRPILKGYRELIANLDDDLNVETYMRESIQENIEALQTSYTWVAYRALTKIISTRDSLIMTHGKDRYVEVDKEYALEVHQTLSTWYEMNEDRLHWDEREQAFTDANGEEFVLPRLDFSSVVINEKTDRWW